MDIAALITQVVDENSDELVLLRRNLHAHPERSWEEQRTTRVAAHHLDRLGWKMTPMPRSGLVAELGPDSGEGVGTIALRADMDALPIHDETADPWSSTIEGVAHACGHDLHVTCLLGAAYALTEMHRHGMLGGRVRLLLQPAEETMPGGALHMMNQGALDDVRRIFALHADPTVDVGQVGLRAGPITSASDHVIVRISGPGGHTSRPHRTGDVTFALATLATELPAVLSRRLDPRAGASMVWGMIRAGSASNVIPQEGLLSGTLRILDAVAWAEAEPIVQSAVADIVRPYAVEAVVEYTRGVPPVVNDDGCHQVLVRAVLDVLGPGGQVATHQSLGGEDFGWYLDRIPGAMFRLGTRTPGGPTYDLHQGNLRVDDRAVPVGAKVLAAAAAEALATMSNL
ncbi:amidohydrolase [Nocardioides sp. CER19]|uniref:amidohydrolase n=1 Tax=Nocardioides sp. CER19 TaxID=3038538 RepID=UPI00244BDB86|nr:amidohydrolase [Nocardioides sp. CER19]MDH2413693.1 amidohydrolase [Nocardioides sp. CER19]